MCVCVCVLWGVLGKFENDVINGTFFKVFGVKGLKERQKERKKERKKEKKKKDR